MLEQALLLLLLLPGRGGRSEARHLRGLLLVATDLCQLVRGKRMALLLREQLRGGATNTVRLKARIREARIREARIREASIREARIREASIREASIREAHVARHGAGLLERRDDILPVVEYRRGG